MTYKIIKSNLVVFGKFYFPPIPQTMIQLMQAFQSHRMMPQILNVVEGTGKPSQRVSLFRHEDGMSIWFADNRIDITQNSLTNCLATDDFLKVASELLNSLSNLGYRYSRVGLAVETLLERGHQGDYEELRERFLPSLLLIAQSGALAGSMRFIVTMKSLTSVMTYKEWRDYSSQIKKNL